MILFVSQPIRHTTSRRASTGSGRGAPAAHPRKALGQHFLTDETALQQIVAAAALAPDESVLEIGAGTGELTAALLGRGRGIVAVELDESLCRSLRNRFSAEADIRVVNANVLDYSPGELLSEAALTAPYVVVANIPYYITAPILRHFLEATQPPRRLILTVQREVAEALAAGPGNMSLLGASVQFYASVEVLFYLKPEAFRPAPKVESAVVRVTVAPHPRAEVEDVPAFFEVLRAGFRSPRKQLHNAVSRGLWMPPGEAVPLLRSAGIDPQRRAQTLSLDQWASLARRYTEQRRSWEGKAADA